MTDKRITYVVVGFLPGRPGEAPPKIVQEHVDGCPVNEYTGYDKGTFLTLYPRRQLMPSTLGMRKMQVSIFDTVRGY